MLLDTKDFVALPHVDLVNTSGMSFSRYVLSLYNVFESGGSPNPTGRVLTLLVSVNGGQSFDAGPNYSDGGLSLFNPEGIAHVDYPINRADGFHVGVDASDFPAAGTSGRVEVFSRGVVGGNAVHTSALVHTVRGEQGGNVLTQVASGLYRGAPGSRVNAFRFQCNLSAEPAAVISGCITLEGF